MTIRNALYALSITMEPDERWASGVIGLRDGWIVGGDSFFFYTGSYQCDAGKRKGELITGQHTEAVGLNLLFGGCEVRCGFSGTYGAYSADVTGTALVGKASVPFRAELSMLVPFADWWARPVP